MGKIKFNYYGPSAENYYIIEENLIKNGSRKINYDKFWEVIDYILEYRKELSGVQKEFNRGFIEGERKIIEKLISILNQRPKTLEDKFL